jgi:hypothetical protein
LLAAIAFNRPIITFFRSRMPRVRHLLAEPLSRCW